MTVRWSLASLRSPSSIYSAFCHFCLSEILIIAWYSFDKGKTNWMSLKTKSPDYNSSWVGLSSRLWIHESHDDCAGHTMSYIIIIFSGCLRRGRLDWQSIVNYLLIRIYSFNLPSNQFQLFWTSCQFLSRAFNFICPSVWFGFVLLPEFYSISGGNLFISNLPLPFSINLILADPPIIFHFYSGVPQLS